MAGWPNNSYTTGNNQNMGFMQNQSQMGQRMPMQNQMGQGMQNQMRQGMPMQNQMRQGMQNQNQMGQRMPMQNQMGMQNQNQMGQRMPMQNQMGMQNQNQMGQRMPMQNQMGMQNQNQMRQGMPMQNQMGQGMPMQNQMGQGMPMQNQMGQGMPMQNQMGQGMPMQNQMGQGMPMQGMPQMGTAMQDPNMNQGMQPPAMPREGIDGVRFEPLDANTIKELKNSFASAGKEQANEPNAPVDMNREKAVEKSSEEITVVQSDNKAYMSIEGRIGEFMQNERNADEFYRRLSSAAPAKHKKYLREMASEAKNREAVLGKIYESMKGREFIAENRKIEKVSNYRRGLTRAIEEEINSVKELSSFYESLHEEKEARKINSMVHKKIGDLCYLNMALHEL